MRTGRAGDLLVFASFLLVSAVWTWPTLRFGGHVATRHFDLYPSLWLLGAAPEVGPHLWSAETAWPLGESLRRADSYVLLLIGMGTGRWLDPVVLVSLLAWLGPAVNAWFAERCAARAFAVPRPWSWIAGCAYGFSGIAGTALLEGHVHHLLNPWLPLLLSAAWRLRDGSTRWQAGIPAGLWWALSLYTSGYFGVLGALVLLVATLGRVTVPLLGTALVSIPAGLGYLWLFAPSTHVVARSTEQTGLWVTGANTLTSLVAGTPSLDLAGHSVAAPLGFAGFWLWMAAPVLLRKEGGWRDLWLLALFMCFLGFGARLRLDPWGDPGVVSPAAWLTTIPGVAWFRFPVRFAWLYSLLTGIIAARVARRLSDGVPAPVTAGLFLLVLGDCFMGAGLPWRLPRQLASAPSAYDAAPDAPLLDLYALPPDRSRTEGELRARALSCFYQSRHGRPILETCIGTAVDSPREVVNAWIEAELFQADVDARWVAEQVGRLGIGAIAVHASSYRPSDLTFLRTRLDAAFGPATAESADGGEHVVLYVVPRIADPAPLKIWERMRGRVLGT